MLDREIAKELFDMLIEFKKHAKHFLSLPSCSPLTETQFKTLIILKNFEKGTLKELSQQLNVSSSSLSIMLNKLVEEGWVKRVYHHTDRRLTFFILSENGNQFIHSQVENKLLELEAHISKLPMEDRESLIKSMSSIGDFLKRIV